LPASDLVTSSNFPSLADIAEQMRWHGVFHARLHTLDIGIDMAVRDQNVRPAVAVIIEEEAAEAEMEQEARPISERGASSTKSPLPSL